jgi:hypothetical protein
LSSPPGRRRHRTRLVRSFTGVARDQSIVETLMIPLAMIVLDKSMIACRKCRSPSGMMRSRHSSLIDLTNRWAQAFAFGALRDEHYADAPVSELTQYLRKVHAIRRRHRQRPDNLLHE